MAKVALAALVWLAASVASVAGQVPAAAPEQQYLFINGLDSKKVVAAGNEGYEVQLVARFEKSFEMLLRRDGEGPRTYRVAATSRLSTFVKELNEAGAQGFRLVPRSVKRTFAVLEQQPNGARYKYVAVKGAEGGARALAELGQRGSTLVAVLAAEAFTSLEPVVLLEEVEGAVSQATTAGRDYRVLATTKTSTLEKEITQAAAEGFRVVRAGFMTVVMERDPAATVAPADYRIVAMLRTPTAERELQAAGAEGYRIALVPEHEQEGVFVLHRSPSASERYDYRVVKLKHKSANEVALQAEADGYRAVVLFNDIAVFERQVTR
jgi:hypothetical protein